MGPALSGGLAAAAVIAVAAIVLGVANVEVTEYGLNYSLLTRKAEKRTYEGGRYWIGPMNHMIKYPSVLTTIQFSDVSLQKDLYFREQSGEQTLRSRTQDGLDVNLEISFQYQIQKPKLYDLYLKLGTFPEYHQIFIRLAIDQLTEAATQFLATEFFTDRTRIGKVMEKQLKQYVEDKLYSTIFSFQLQSVGLPQPFEEAIQETEVHKQDVKIAAAEQNSKRVALDTELMQAERRTKVTKAKAEARAQSMMLANKADIEQFRITQEKSADGYAEVLNQLEDNQAGLFAYMQARALRDHASDKVTVGLSMDSLEDEEGD